MKYILVYWFACGLTWMAAVGQPPKDPKSDFKHPLILMAIGGFATIGTLSEIYEKEIRDGKQ